MKRNITIYFSLALMALAAPAAIAQSEPIRVAGEAVAVNNLSVSNNDNNLVVDMDVDLSQLEMRTNQRIVLTPIVTAQGHAVHMNPIVVNGRRQHITFERVAHKRYAAGAVAVKRKNGSEQSVHYTQSVPYEAWMKNANVSLAQDLCGCGDVEDQYATVLERMRSYNMAYHRPMAEAQKVRKESGRAYIDFPVNKITLYPEYRKNPAELDKIVNSIKVVHADKNTTITGIKIHGYASPESPYEHNAYLAENRAATLKNYVSNLSGVKASVFSVASTPEDWDGLREAVEEGALEHKEQILQLIDSDLHPDVKEQRIRARYPGEYNFMLREWYPALRHSDYEITYQVRPFTVDEAKALLYSKPQMLSLEEMFLVAQTYEPGSSAFNEVFNIAVRMYPESEVANANVACSYLEMGDYDKAETYLKRAGALPETLNARGIIAAKRGHTGQARALWQQAAEAGLEQAKQNLALLETD